MIGKTSNSCGQVQASLATWFQPIGSTSKHLYSVSETWKSWSWNPRSEATETGKTIKCSCDSVQSPNSSAVSASNVEWPRALVLHFSASWLAKSYCLILHSHFPSNQSFTLCGLLVRISQSLIHDATAPFNDDLLFRWVIIFQNTWYSMKIFHM